MINHEKLNNILIDYKKDFKSNHWNNEKYKWEAVEHFQKNWDINASNFLPFIPISPIKNDTRT